MGAAVIGNSMELRPSISTDVEGTQEMEAEEEDECDAEEEDEAEEGLVGVSRRRSSAMLTTALRMICGDFNLGKGNGVWDSLTAVASERAGLCDAVPDCEATFGNID